MLMAGGAGHRTALRFEALTDREGIMKVGITRQFDFELGRYRLPSEKVSTVVFGRSFSTPYGTVSSAEKQELGRRLKERLGV